MRADHMAQKPGVKSFLDRELLNQARWGHPNNQVAAAWPMLQAGFPLVRELQDLLF